MCVTCHKRIVPHVHYRWLQPKIFQKTFCGADCFWKKLEKCHWKGFRSIRIVPRYRIHPKALFMTYNGFKFPGIICVLWVFLCHWGNSKIVKLYWILSNMWLITWYKLCFLFVTQIKRQKSLHVAILQIFWPKIDNSCVSCKVIFQKKKICIHL